MRSEHIFGVSEYFMDVWDGGCHCLEQRLEILKSCGFDGIELLTANDAVEAVQNASLFHRRGMDFASCSLSIKDVLSRAPPLELKAGMKVCVSVNSLAATSGLI